MNQSSPDIGLIRDVGEVNVAPAVTPDGQPALAIWAGTDAEAAILPAALLTRLVLALADCAAEAGATAHDLGALRGLL